MHWITQHYGLDWAAGTLLLVSLIRLGARKRDGFLLGAASAVFWVLFNIKVDSPPGIAINTQVAILSVRSWLLWSRKPDAQPSTG